MDAELRELERLFEAAQQAKPSARLSERNVVELVLKLQQIGLLDSDLLHTLSGKEYLTQDRLRQEMESEIRRLGRVSLIDLASTIGVDYYHCERQANYLEKSIPELMIKQGEVFSSNYWDNLAEEVNETLQEASQLSLADLARRFDVGVELLTGILSSRIGSVIHGKLEGGQLYTPAYLARVKAVVRGAIRALTVPTSLQSVWNCVHNLLQDGDDSGVTAQVSLFHKVLNELLSENSIKGSLRGGSTWTPAVFAQSQRESIEAFYSQNSYITYDALKKLNVSQPKQYLQNKYPDGIALETVFVHASFISLLDSGAEEAIAGGRWFDALDVVPSTFGTHESGKLLALCPSVQSAIKESTASLMAETCVVSSAFVKGLLEKFEGILRETQEKAMAVVKTHTEPVKSKTEPEPENKKKTDKRQQNEVADEEVKSGKNKKKSAKAKTNKTSSTKETLSKGSKTEDNDVPSEEKLAENIIEWYPDIEAAGTEDGYSGALAKSLAVQLRPSLISYVASLKRAYLTAQADERRKGVEALQQKINEGYSNLQLFTKALDLFEGDKTMETLLHRHLLRTTAAEIADVFLEAQVLENRSENAENSEMPTKPFTSSTRMALAKSLPGSYSACVIEMVEALEGKNVEAFDTAFETAVKESGLRLKKFDKKAERALLHGYRKTLTEQVEQEKDPISLLPKVVALLYTQVHGRPLQAPGRALSAAVSRLKGAIPDEGYETLEEYHADTVAYLSNTSANEKKKELLEQRMEDLKAITRTVDKSS